MLFLSVKQWQKMDQILFLCGSESICDKPKGCECFPAGGDEWAVWAAQ